MILVGRDYKQSRASQSPDEYVDMLEKRQLTVSTVTISGSG